MENRPVPWNYGDKGRKNSWFTISTVENVFRRAEQMKKTIPSESIAYKIIHSYMFEETILHSVVDTDYVSDPVLWEKKADRAVLLCLKRNRRSFKKRNLVVIG